MSKLLEDYDNNSIEEDFNTICNCIDIVNNTIYREYIQDLTGYSLLKKKYKIDIIQNNDIEKKTTCDFLYYYNSDTKSFYLKYETPFYLRTDLGHLGFIIKNNNKIIRKISFKYKLNNPIYNTDIVKILTENYEFYIYLKRKDKESDFYFYKLIFKLLD
tara:strand:+ start:8980 stop:9456 length:477 start_codon:yes stop_codon:yes gene_type:complete